MSKNTKIAFILHPLSVYDFHNKVFFYSPLDIPIDFILKITPPPVTKKFYSKLPPHIFMEENGVRSKCGNQVSIVGIMCPMFPEEIFVNPDSALQKITNAVKVAIKAGCKIVVLGGFTSIIGNQGVAIKEKFGEQIVITSGNTFTAALTFEGILSACKIFNKRIESSSVAIIGATGDIGSTCAKIFSFFAKEIILSSRKVEETNQIIQEILKQKTPAKIFLEKDIQLAVKNADIVVAATSSIVPLISPKDLKAGSIVCDVSLPHNVGRDILAARDDIFVFDGGKAKLSTHLAERSNKWQKFAYNNSIYGCLAEGIILGFEGMSEDFSLGRGNINQERVSQILGLGYKHGIELANFTFYDKLLSQEHINKIKKKMASL